jgi:hypothetical protein
LERAVGRHGDISASASATENGPRSGYLRIPVYSMRMVFQDQGKRPTPADEATLFAATQKFGGSF